MWMEEARKLCPQIVVLPYDFDAFAEAALSMYRVVFAETAYVEGGAWCMHQLLLTRGGSRTLLRRMLRHDACELPK